MKIRLMLTACAVIFEIMPVQPDNRMGDQAGIEKISGETEVRENFQNLFESIANKDKRNSEIYKTVLKQEVARKRQAFDDMKEDLQRARSRKFVNKNNFYKKSNINGRTVEIIKRQIKPPKTDLPGHNDTFQSIRAKNLVYVDKSSYIMKLLESEHRFFRMCRPGRFGKSNFMQMLNAFFRGDKELFDGLAVNERHDWQKSYPVIYLDFSTMNISSLYALQTSLDQAIVQTGRSYGLELDEDLPLYPEDIQGFHKLQCGNDSKVGLLMDHLTSSGKNERSVVVLIDEYDWPLRSYPPRYAITHIRDRTTFGNFLNPFFHQFELMKRYVKFLFMTCTSISSYEMRSRTQYPDCPIELEDLTFDSQFGGMIGLTSDELKSNLKPHVNAMISQPAKESFDTVVEQLRKRYNGYCFGRTNASTDSDQCRLFNFHSVMTCLRDKNPDYLWHPAADPRYNIVEDYEISNAVTGDNVMRYLTRVEPDSFLVSRNELERARNISERIPVSVCMVLYGYLTLRGYDEREDKFALAFPNDEVRQSFHKEAVKFVLGRAVSPEYFHETCNTVRLSMVNGEAKIFVDSLNTLAFQPADREARVYSQKYPQMMYTPQRIVDVFKMCDYGLRGNSSNDYGGLRIELNDVYITEHQVDVYEYFGVKMEWSDQVECWIRFEFRRSASSAVNVLLKALEDRLVKEPRKRSIHLIGINVDSIENAIEEWIWIALVDGKFKKVQASHPHYLAMYDAYVANLHPKLNT